MKKWLWAFVLAYSCISAFSERVLPDGMVPFNPKGVSVEWSMPSQPTNRLKVFRVVPRSFNVTTVSNLLTLGELSEKDLDAHSGNSHDTNAVRFSSKKRGQNWLLIVPSQGWVNLKLPTPDKNGQEGDLVPSTQAVIERGSNLLVTLFGITTNELAYKKPGQLYVTCMEGTTTSLNRQLKKRVKAMVHRGVHFYRVVDGCPVLGLGGATVDFVDHGKVNNLELIWRRLELAREVPRPSLEYFKEAVAKGAAFLGEGEAQPAKRLVLQSVDYCYEEKPGEELQTTFYPFARLAGVVRDDDQTSTPIYLFCPVPDEK